MIHFSISGEIDPLAVYAALLSTAIAGWEFWKWKNKNNIKIQCNPNMKVMPSADNKTYVVASVTNTGMSQTTITHLIFYYWKKWPDKIMRKKECFIVNCPDLPKVIQPGEQWMGKADQDENIERMAREGLLYMGVIHSMGSKEILCRIKIKK